MFDKNNNIHYLEVMELKYFENKNDDSVKECNLNPNLIL